MFVQIEVTRVATISAFIALDAAWNRIIYLGADVPRIDATQLGRSFATNTVSAETVQAALTNLVENPVYRTQAQQ